ncbi:MAG: hypothetical protein RLZZ292_818 [Bacteroidota bacterium]
MTNKWMHCRYALFVLLVPFIMSSCSTSIPNYLPTIDNIDTNRFGSHIVLNCTEGYIQEGELIAIDSGAITILTGDYNFQANKEMVRETSDSTRQALKSNQVHRFVKVVPLKEIERFSLQYAEGKKYGWTALFGLLLSASHGFLFVGSAPVNLVVIGIVASDSNNAFKYNNKTISYTKLRMFARFPQGIPPNVELNKIR